MPNTITPVVYTSRNGTEFLTGMDSEVFSQMSAEATPRRLVGGRAATSADAGLPPLPRNIKPRRAYAKNPAGKGRYIMLLSAGTPLEDGAVEDITIEDSDGTGTVYTVKKVKSEDFRSRV